MSKPRGLPITREIKSLKSLDKHQQKRLKQLVEIFKKENRIPLGVSLQEKRYLYKLLVRRRCYLRRKQALKLRQEAYKEATREQVETRTSSSQEALSPLRKRIIAIMEEASKQSIEEIFGISEGEIYEKEKT